MSTYRIYALFTRDSKGSRSCFYVGKTRRTVAARVREHGNRKLRGHEDLYEHLRRLDREQVAWECEELRHCTLGEYEQDAERFEVVRLLRDGHDLCNMRYGDATHRAELARMKEDPTIRCAADVTKARLAAAAPIQVRRQVKAKGRLRRKELAAMLKESGIASVQRSPLLRGVLARRLAPREDVSVAKEMKLRELVQFARDFRRWATLVCLEREINARHPLGHLGSGE